MSRIRYNQNTKDANMTLRCTKEEKERIVKKAKQNGKCIGEYLLDSAIVGCERRSKKSAKRISQVVKQQEALNGLYESIKTIQNEKKREELLENFKETVGEWKKIWEYC